MEVASQVKGYLIMVILICDGTKSIMWITGTEISVFVDKGQFKKLLSVAERVNK